jgi:hypothetical protein
VRTVVISFDPADPAKVGTTQELPDDKARQLVATGRARYVKPTGDHPSGTSDAPEQPAPVEEQPPPAEEQTVPAEEEAAAPPPSGRKPKATS